MDVSVRELREGLNRYLAAVREGRSVTVMDHGRPVARLVPVDRPTTALQRLVAEGRVRPPVRQKRPAPSPVEGSGPLSDLVADQRR